jgi:hypothetical protein
VFLFPVRIGLKETLDQFLHRWQSTHKSVEKAREKKLGSAGSRVYLSGTKSEVSIDSFYVEGFLGRGAFGKVYRVRKKDSGALYALKSLRRVEIDNQVVCGGGGGGGGGGGIAVVILLIVCCLFCCCVLL